MAFQSFEQHFSRDTFKPPEGGIQGNTSQIAFQFKKIIRSSLSFHLFFQGMLLLELFSSFFVLSYAPKSPLMALLLSGFLLTCFTYLILIYYFQAKRPEQYSVMQEEYFSAYSKEIESYPKLIESTVNIIEKEFHAFEEKIFTPLLRFANATLHKKELLRISEQFIRTYLHMQIETLKKKPLDLHLHATLIHGFFLLGKLLKKDHPERHKKAISCALEELTILQHFIPEDPWVYAQIASCYHDLGNMAKEMEIYEILSRMRPRDKEILFRLGSLYFRNGKLARGLEVYRELARIDESLSNKLIALYETGLNP